MPHSLTLTINYDQFIEDVQAQDQNFYDEDVSWTLRSGGKVTLGIHHVNQEKPDTMRVITSWGKYIGWRDHVQVASCP